LPAAQHKQQPAELGTRLAPTQARLAVLRKFKRKSSPILILF
jgi:hypothetical protein